MVHSRTSSDAASTSSASASVRSSTSLLAPSALLSEKLTSLPRSRTPSIPSVASLGNIRRRGIYLTVLTVLFGILFANVFFNFASSGHSHTSYNNFQHYLSDRLNSHRHPNQINNRLLAGSKPTVVAFVSFSSRSRTETLDCYLKQNLVHNGGLLDRVIFNSETSSEMELNWLRKVVVDTDGYNLISTSYDGSAEQYAGLSDKLIPFPDADEISGSVGRSWKLAEAIAQNMAQVSEPGRPEPLFLFIDSETIYLSPTTIVSMIYTQQTRPEYSIVQANVVNQPVLSWLHSRMGVVKPYRPEGKYLEGETELLPSEPNTEVESTQSESSIFDKLRKELASAKAEKRSDSAYFPWRASELPIWSPENTATFSSIDNSAAAPLLFGVPIDFEPPSYKHRWLPYDERQMSLSFTSDTLNSDLDFHQRPSLSSPLTQRIFSLTGPGKWPWTLSAQQLFSFLEHLEEEEDLSISSATDHNCTAQRRGIGGLARYHLPLWTFSTSPTLAPTLFLISASDLLALSPSFPFYIRPAAAGGSAQQNEEPTLARWITSESVVTQHLNGRGAVVDGHAIAARFLPGNVGSDSLDVDAREMRRGLESTDLLERFRGYAEEIRCKGT